MTGLNPQQKGKACTQLLVKWWWVIVAVLVAIGIACAFYWWPWSGFGGYKDADGNWQREKTLWDWMDLLIVPCFLAIIAFAFDRTAKARDRKRELNRSREDALQAYLDQVSNLMLEKALCASQPNSEVRYVARAQTLTALRRLDGERKGILIRFLYDAKLIEDKAAAVDLDEADLSEASLRAVCLEKAALAGAYLNGADLCFADLSGANLGRAVLNNALLRGAVLNKANLSEARLLGADLHKADLSEANLSKAVVTDEQLNQAQTLEGATMPDDEGSNDIPPVQTEATADAEPAPLPVKTEPQDAEERPGQAYIKDVGGGDKGLTS
jgi:uncharacterized protein YjbI with pentapeptide repeats